MGFQLFSEETRGARWLRCWGAAPRRHKPIEPHARSKRPRIAIQTDHGGGKVEERAVEKLPPFPHGERLGGTTAPDASAELGPQCLHRLVGLGEQLVESSSMDEPQVAIDLLPLRAPPPKPSVRAGG